MNKQTTRIQTIDIIRGFAVCGILFANILVLGGYTVLSYGAQARFASSEVDQWLILLTDIFIKYKFYTLFAFLFGFGFSILFKKANDASQHFVRTYLMRLSILFIIGWIHALFIFHADIIRMYVIVGLFLIFFKDISNRYLLWAAVISLFIPIVIAISQQYHLFYVDPGVHFPYSKKKALAAMQHGPFQATLQINYDRTLAYLGNYLPSRRFFKILGLMLLGFYVGRKQIFYHLDDYIPYIKRLLPFAWILSVSANIFYTEHVEKMHPIEKEVWYLLSVYPLSFTYIISIIYICRHAQNNRVAQSFANVGRMTMTHYIGQNILAAMLMLWYGAALAGTLHVSTYYLIALGIIITLFIFSHYWLKYFKHGPLEALLYCCKKNSHGL